MVRNIKLLIPGLLAVLCLMLAPSGVLAQEVLNQIVAVVGDDVITTFDLNKLQANLEKSLGPPANETEAEMRKKQIAKLSLERLIEDKIFGQEVKRLGIRVSDQDVERYIDRLKKTNGITDDMFAAQLSRRGITPEEYKDGIKKDMLKARLIRRQVKNQVVISDNQVDDHIRKNKGQFKQLDQVRIQALFLKIPEKADENARRLIKRKAVDLRQQAEAKGNLTELAKEYSQGPGGVQGGELGPLSVVDLLPAMRQAVAELKKGEMSPVIEVPGSYVFLKLLDRSGETGLPDSAIREQIREKLERQALEQKFKEWMTKLREKTYVKILDKN
ncbi:peptidylprolyl isomerase [Dethiosulfatarculus sandiegensis]|nr:SurA N-terminal domain-containing protein [Dethiosulfatarculus sandiegensis]